MTRPLRAFALAACLFAGQGESRVSAEQLVISPPARDLPTILIEVGYPGDVVTHQVLPLRWTLKAGDHPFRGEVVFKYLKEIEGTKGLLGHEDPTGSDVDLRPGQEAAGFQRLHHQPISRNPKSDDRRLRPWLGISLIGADGRERFTTVRSLGSRVLPLTGKLWLRVSERAGRQAKGRTIDAPPLWDPGGVRIEGRFHHVIEVSPEGFDETLVPYEDDAFVAVTFAAWDRLDGGTRRRLLERSPMAPIWLLGTPPPGVPPDRDLAAYLPVAFRPGEATLRLPALGGTDSSIRTTWRWSVRDDRVSTSGGEMPWYASGGPITFLAWDPFEAPGESTALDLFQWQLRPWSAAGQRATWFFGYREHPQTGSPGRLHALVLAASFALPIGIAVWRRHAARNRIVTLAACLLCAGAVVATRAAAPGRTETSALRKDRTISYLEMSLERRSSWCTNWGCSPVLAAEPDDPAVPSGMPSTGVEHGLPACEGNRRRLVRTREGWVLRGGTPISGLYLARTRLLPSGEGRQDPTFRATERGTFEIDASPSLAGGEGLVLMGGDTTSGRRIRLPEGSAVLEIAAAGPSRHTALSLHAFETVSGEWISAPPALSWPIGVGRNSGDALVVWQSGDASSEESLLLARNVRRSEAPSGTVRTHSLSDPATRTFFVSWASGEERGRGLVLNIADATERREGVMAARVRGCDGSVEAEAAWQPAGPSRAGEGAGPAPRAGGPGLVRLPMEALRRACRGGGMYEVDFDATLTKPGVLHASLGSVVP